MSKKRFYPLFLGVFWLFIFFLFRFVFFLFHTDHELDAWKAFVSCLRMDVSMTSYFILLPTLIWGVAQYVKGKNISYWILTIFNFLVLLFVAGVELTSIPLYKEWGTTANARAWSYIHSPLEMWATIKDFAAWYYIVIGFLAIASGFWLNKKLHSNIFFTEKTKWHFFIIPLVIICTSIVMTRGGLQKIPISVSEAFYSSNQNNNYTSVNKTWYFIQSLMEEQNVENSSRYNNEELDLFYTSFFQENRKVDSTTLLKVDNPNIVLVVLESWTAAVIEPLDGLKEVTPNFTRLSKEGLLFTDTYCSGFRTDQGILSIFSGVPAVPSMNMMNQVEIMNGIPSMVTDFNNHDYYTSIFYGGDMNFSNFRNYFLNHGIQKLIDKKNFPLNSQSGDWGLPDHFVFERAFEHLNNQPEPFFSTVITQSSHPPFDIPGEYKFGSKDKHAKFKSALYYSDESLGDFIESCKTKDWYNNTLFVLVADHGAMHLDNVSYNDFKRFHIPFLLYGPALADNYKGKTDSTTMNQHDIPATLLSQLGWEHDAFPLSKNIYQNTTPYVYFASGDAMTWSDKENTVLFDHKTSKVYKKNCPEEKESQMVEQGIKFLELTRRFILKK